MEIPGEVWQNKTVKLLVHISGSFFDASYFDDRSGMDGGLKGKTEIERKRERNVSVSGFNDQ